METIIRPKKLAEICGVHLSTIYRWEEEGRFPFKKRQFGPNTVGFFSSEVYAWLESQPEAQAV